MLSSWRQSLETALDSRCRHDQHNREIGPQADGAAKHARLAWCVSLRDTEETRASRGRPQRADERQAQVRPLGWQSAADAVASVLVPHVGLLDGKVCQVHVALGPVDDAAGVDSGVAATGLALVHQEHRGVVATCGGNGHPLARPPATVHMHVK